MRMSKKRKTSNMVLLVLGIFILLFIITMIVTFWVKGAVPDVLIQYTLGTGGVECLALAAITISKVWVGEKVNSKGDVSNENFYD